MKRESFQEKNRGSISVDDLFASIEDWLHRTLLRFAKKRKKERKGWRKTRLSWREKLASRTVTVLAFSRTDRPLSSHSKELFNERNLCRVSFDMPVRCFLLARGVCSFFLDHRNPTPFRDSNGGYSPLWVNLIVKRRIFFGFDTLQLSSYLPLLLDLFRFFKNRLNEIPSVNHLNTSERSHYTQASYSCEYDCE